MKAKLRKAFLLQLSPNGDEVTEKQFLTHRHTSICQIHWHYQSVVQTAPAGKVPQHIDQLYVGGLALPQALLLGVGDRLLAVSGEAGDGGLRRDGVAVEVRLQVPHELWFDGQEGADHDGQEKPTLLIKER